MKKSSIKLLLSPLLWPSLLWLCLFLARPIFYSAWCAVNPSPCIPSSVNAFDQPAFHYNLIQADFLSNLLQNTLGVLVFLVPWILYWKRKDTALRETLAFAQITLWNAAFVELAHALTQRPRPLVFNDPMGDGANIHQYTSFYSGHTSFIAVATLSCFFMARRFMDDQSKNTPPLRFSMAAISSAFIVLYLGLSILMGSLRVLGGRHYPTDTLAGFIAGSLITIYFQLQNDAKR